MEKTVRSIALMASAAIILSGCCKDCEDEVGNVTAAERTWISYAPGATVLFLNTQGDTSALTAGVIEDRAHNGGGSKGDCKKNYHSLHQALSGIGLFVGAELAVVHDRETGNAPGYVCGYYMEGIAPVHSVLVNGTDYDDVYITPDSLYYFTKADGLIKAGEWRKIP